MPAGSRTCTSSRSSTCQMRRASRSSTCCSVLACTSVRSCHAQRSKCFVSVIACTCGNGHTRRQCNCICLRISSLCRVMLLPLLPWRHSTTPLLSLLHSVTFYSLSSVADRSTIAIAHLFWNLRHVFRAFITHPHQRRSPPLQTRTSTLTTRTAAATRSP